MAAFCYQDLDFKEIKSELTKKLLTLKTATTHNRKR